MIEIIKTLSLSLAIPMGIFFLLHLRTCKRSHLPRFLTRIYSIQIDARPRKTIGSVVDSGESPIGLHFLTGVYGVCVITLWTPGVLSWDNGLVQFEDDEGESHTRLIRSIVHYGCWK